MDDWIKLPRNITEWDWFDDAPTLKLFIFLLSKANYKEKNWCGFELKKGQVLIGRKKLSEYINISEQTIRTSISKLQRTGDISVNSTNKFSVISICNREDFKWLNIFDQPTTNQQLTNNQPTTNQQLTTTIESKIDRKIEEEKEKDNINIIPKEKTISSRFVKPTIEDVDAYCKERKNGIDATSFFDYYECVGWKVGNNKPMKDWRAAVRNWERQRNADVKPTEKQVEIWQ